MMASQVLWLDMSNLAEDKFTPWSNGLHEVAQVQKLRTVR